MKVWKILRTILEWAFVIGIAIVFAVLVVGVMSTIGKCSGGLP